MQRICVQIQSLSIKPDMVAEAAIPGFFHIHPSYLVPDQRTSFRSVSTNSSGRLPAIRHAPYTQAERPLAVCGNQPW